MKDIYKNDNWTLSKNDELYSMPIPTDEKLVKFGNNKKPNNFNWPIRTSANVYAYLNIDDNFNYGTYLEYWLDDFGWNNVSDVDVDVFDNYMGHSFDDFSDGYDGAQNWTDFYDAGANIIKLIFIDPKNLSETEVKIGTFEDYPKYKPFINDLKKEMEKQQKNGKFLFDIRTEIDPSAFTYDESRAGE